MNVLAATGLVSAAFLAVFFQTWITWPRELLGAQIDLLPAIGAYTAVKASLPVLCVVCGLSGLWLDSLSANPFGVSILPLLGVSLVFHLQRDLLLHDRATAQFFLGLVASAAVPPATLLLLWADGADPLLSWDSFWQWGIMTLGGGCLAPVLFGAFDRVREHFSPVPIRLPSFRPDRQIKRGRS
jgi:hypothetical protein